MAYRTLAWVVSLICGLAIPAGAATLGDGFFDQFTGVVNLNVASGNLNSQSASYSGPDLSSSGLANGGSTRVAAVRR